MNSKLVKPSHLVRVVTAFNMIAHQLHTALVGLLTTIKVQSSQVNGSTIAPFVLKADKYVRVLWWLPMCVWCIYKYIDMLNPGDHCWDFWTGTAPTSNQTASNDLLHDTLSYSIWICVVVAWQGWDGMRIADQALAIRIFVTLMLCRWFRLISLAVLPWYWGQIFNSIKPDNAKHIKQSLQLLYSIALL